MIKTCRRWNPTWRSCCMNKARPYFLLYSMKMQHYVLIAEQSILKHKQTGTEKSDYNVFSKITHCGSCPVAKKKKKRVHSIHPFKVLEQLPTGWAYIYASCPTTNLQARSSPPPELISLSSFNWAASPPNCCCPPLPALKLNSYMHYFCSAYGSRLINRILLSLSMTWRHIDVSYKNLFPYTLRFIYLSIKKT